MYQGRRRSAARLLAPLALLLAVAAVLVVVQASNESDDVQGRHRARDRHRAGHDHRRTPSEPRRVRPTYTVKLNDTLGLISEKTGVSVERIETLNPELDPQNLIVGQKIKLRE